MATDSADGSELDVSLPPSLAEWLDERAAALDLNREELLVQLVSTYRATADLEDDPTVDGFQDEELESRIAEIVDAELESVPPAAEFEPLEDRLDGLESELDENVEDLRNRIIQLRDEIKNRASKDHTHSEIETLEDRLDGLAESIDEVGSDTADVANHVEGIDERLSDVESKLNRLARVVVALRNQHEETASERNAALDHIRLRANRLDITKARCESCDEDVRISLLTEPACPHCGTELRDVEPPGSTLGGMLNVRKPKLVDSKPPALESADE